MALNLDDFFRAIQDHDWVAKTAVPVATLQTEATRQLDKHGEATCVERELGVCRKEFKVRRGKLIERKRELHRKEEELKGSLLKFNKFVEENECKQARALKKAEKEQEVSQQKAAELQQLLHEEVALQEERLNVQVKVQKLSIYRDFLKHVVEQSNRFDDIRELVARLTTLWTTREQQRQQESEREEQVRQQGRQQQQSLDELSVRILQCNNQLSLLQMDLDRVRSHVFKLRSKWNHFQATAAKEALLLCQVKMVTLNLFYITGGRTEERKGVHVSDTEGQLERIKQFLQDKGDTEIDRWTTDPAA